MGLMQNLKDRQAQGNRKMREAREQYHRDMAEMKQTVNQAYICPKDNGTMRFVNWRMGAAFRKPIVRCQSCGFEMLEEIARKELRKAN